MKGVSNRYYCYGNQRAGSQPILKLLITSIDNLYQKIISKCCELVKLCHIDRSGPVFTARRVRRARLCRGKMSVCLSVCPSHAGYCVWTVIYIYPQTFFTV